MNTEQQPQPDWADQLIKQLMRCHRDEQHSDLDFKFPDKTASALIRAEFERRENSIAIPEDGVPQEKWMRVGPCCVVDLRNQLAALETVCAKMKEALEHWRVLRDESKGLSGYHLNGDVAEWGEFDDPTDAAIALTPADVADQMDRLQKGWDNASANSLKYEGECNDLRDQIAQLQAELAPLRELVGVDSRAKSALTDIDHWRKMQAKADRAEAAEAKLAEAETVNRIGIHSHFKDQDQITNLQAELKAARELLAYIDQLAPRADSTCAEPGITFTEACKRQMADAARGKEVQ